MINLLSAELQAAQRAARLNVQLRSYIAVLVAMLLAILLVFAVSFFLSYQQRVAAEEIIDSNQQVISQYASTRQATENFHSNLSIAKSILSQETLYSDLTVRITQTLPKDAILTSLILSEESLDEPISFAARVKSHQAAVVLKNTLEDSALFSEVSLINVQEDISDNTPKIYHDHPITVSLQAKLDVKAIHGGKL